MSLDELIAESGVLEAQREAYEKGIEAIPKDHGMRAVWLGPLRTFLDKRAPEQLAAYDAFAERFSFRPFSYAPVPELFLCAIRMGTLLWPDEAAEVATNRLTSEAIEIIASDTVLQPLVTACDGDLALFMQFSAQSQKIFYNFGSLAFERVGPKELALHYEGHSQFFTRHYALGFHEGLLRMFGYEGEARFEEHGDLDCSVIVELA